MAYIEGMDLKLKDLRYLVAVADARHFGKAAAACFVSQPTLSAQLKKLEENLGVQLIERAPNNVSLTVAGEQIVARARGTSSKSCPAAFTQLDRARVLRHCDDGGKLVITCQAPGAITGDHGPVARALPVERYRAAGMACVSSLCWRL